MVTGLLNVVAQKLAVDQNSLATDPSLSAVQSVVTRVPFLPVMPRPDQFPLPWCVADSSRMCPAELYSSDCADLVCCIRPVADADVFPKSPPDFERLESFLELSAAQRFPSVDDLLRQLHAVVGHVAERGIPSAAEEFDDFQRVVTRVGDVLQRHCNDVAARRQIGESLRDTPFVLVSGHLLRPRQVAFGFAHACFPYLGGVPDAQRQRIGDLLAAVGVRDSFDTSAYVTALHSMSVKHGSAPLDKDSLRLALQVGSLLFSLLSLLHAGA